MEERDFPGSTLWEVAKERFKRPTTIRERVVSVATSATEILNNNPRRVFWMVCNRHTANGAIGFSPQVSFDTGLLLAANGGVASMTAEEDGEAVGYAVYGILQFGPGNWWVLEVIAL